MHGAAKRRRFKPDQVARTGAINIRPVVLLARALVQRHKPSSEELAAHVRLKFWDAARFSGHAMTRLLSILLLASLLGGFAARGIPAPHAQSSQAPMSSQTGGDSDGPMAADCVACAAMGACIASGPAQSAGPGISQLPPTQPSSRLSDQTCAPDTAPPKPSSN